MTCCRFSNSGVLAMPELQVRRRSWRQRIRVSKSEDGVFDSRGENQIRGATAVEMAIVLPILFVMVFGIIEFGRAIMVNQILVNAAREATRRAVVPGATDESVNSIISDYMTGAGISDWEAFVEIDGVRNELITDAKDDAQNTNAIVTALPKSKVTVELSVLYSSVAWGPMYLLSGDKNLIAKVTMRKE